MDDEHQMNSDMSTIAESNLGGVLFSDYSSGNLILTSDVGGGLPSFEGGTLCFDETNNELVYVNMPLHMLQSSINGTDSLPGSQSVFSSLGGSIPSLSDLPLFNDGGQVMLFTGGSIVIPNDNEDDDNLVSANSTDPFILEYVSNVQHNLDGSKVTEAVQPEPNPSTSAQKTARNESKISASAVAGSRSEAQPTMSVAEKKENRYGCKICTEKFTSYKNYRKHLLNHNDLKMHQCKCCGASFNKLRNLILHEAIHDPNDTRCPLTTCQKKFKRKASLKAHMKLHEEEETLACTECGEEFHSQLYLELHYKCQSQCRLNVVEPQVKETKVYQCKLCDRSYEDADLFAIHKKEHERLRKALATKSHKKKTMNNIPSSRINRCKMCTKWFVKPSQLIRHMRIHTGERPFKCNLCSKAFNQANSLKIHMLKHTGDRPFQCPFCMTGFSQRGNLRQHINRVHSIPKVEENVYKCTECSCIFKKMCSLNAHKNRVHQQRYFTAQQSAEEQSQQRQQSVGGETAITIENGLEDVNDEDMNELLDKEGDINTISIMFENGNGTVSNQKVFVKKKGDTRYYRCSHCPKQNVKLREIIRHLKFSILGKPFKCEHCSKMFSQQSTFLTHLTLHATAKLYQCTVCEKSFPNPAEMKIHFKTHSDIFEQQFCTNCSLSYPNNEFENHSCVIMPLLNLNKPCETRYEASDTGKVHDKVSLILPPYDCTYCDILFESYAKLKQHLYSTHDAALCEICCLQFPNKEKLKEHSLTNHLEDVNERTCSRCNKVFRTKYSRDLHFVTHLKKRKNEIKCDKCSITCKGDVALSRHIKRFHSTDTPLKPTVELLEKEEALQLSTLENDSVGLIPTDFETDGSIYISSVGVVIDGSGCTADEVGSENSTRVMNTAHVDNFSMDDASTFVTSESMNVGESSNEFMISEGSAFMVPEECIHETIPTSTESEKGELLTSSNESEMASRILPSEMLSLGMEENLFDFSSSVIPVEVTNTESLPSATFNVPGAVIYRCTKCYQQYLTELDLQKHFQESETCNNGMPNIVDSYFYACNTCYLTFKNLPTFLKHLQTHDGPKTFECLYCESKNKTQAQLTHHIAQHSLRNEFPCVYCGELFSSLETVKKHITDIHLMSSIDKKSEPKRKKSSSNELLLSEKEKILLACQKPHKYSSISEKVLSSLLKNINKNESKEKDEEEETLKERKRKTGMKKNQKENVCNYCSRVFKKVCDLIRHIRTHTGEKPFKCDYCSKCFTVKSILNCHLKTHFSVNNIFCHVCNRFFATVGSLKTHMRLHTGERPYKCLYCKETFRTSGHRDSHQKRHLSDKDKSKSKLFDEAVMIEIEDNNNNSGLELNLQDAVDLQETEFVLSDMDVPENFKFQDIDLADLSNLPITVKRTHTCVICRKSFKRKADLDRHMNIHSSEGGYTCQLCDARFNQLDTFKTHIRRHSNDQTWSCDKCGNSFASAKNLRVHKVRNHPESVNMPMKDENKGKVVEIAETDKDVNRWNINLSIFDDKSLNGCGKKAEDFYIVDKQFDLSSMMQDLFPDEK